MSICERKERLEETARANRMNPFICFGGNYICLDSVNVRRNNFRDDCDK